MPSVLWKTKNFLFKTYKKLILFVFLFLVLPKIVFAGALADLATRVATWPFYFIISLVVKVAIWITKFCGAFLKWVLSPDFIKYSYTNPTGTSANPIIKAGLDVTSGLANMILVLVLVYVAIAIMLQLAGRESKKLLVTFIIIALLVNFSPVICRIIVDASNVIMNHFTKDLGPDAFGEAMANKLVRMEYKYDENIDLEVRFQIIAQLAVLVPFILILGFILVIFAFVFIFRYIAIWILVILSPIAFVFYIVPSTRKYFEQWWTQFINWSFIGATCSFFLYLALYLVMNIQTSANSVVDTSTIQIENTTGAFEEILPFFVALAFLGIGLVFGLKTSAIGASSVINFAKSARRKGARTVAKGAGIAARQAAKTTATAAVGAVRGAREGQGVRGRIAGAVRGAATYEGREKGRESTGRILERMHLVKPGTYEEHRRKRWKVDEESKKMEKMSTDRLREITDRKIIRPADQAGSLAAFEALAKRGALRDADRPLLRRMQSFGADTSQILKARPDWAPDTDRTINQQVAGVSTGDFTKNTQAAALGNADVIAALDLPKIRHIGQRGTAEQKAELRNAMAPDSNARRDLINKARQIQQEADQLKQQGNIEWRDRDREWKQMINVMKEIKTNNNFK